MSQSVRASSLGPWLFALGVGLVAAVLPVAAGQAGAAGAEGDATVKLMADLECVVTVDGTEVGRATPAAPLLIRVSPGQHRVQATHVATGATWAGLAEVAVGGEQVLMVELEAAAAAARAASSGEAAEEGRAAEDEEGRQEEGRDAEDEDGGREEQPQPAAEQPSRPSGAPVAATAATVAGAQGWGLAAPGTVVHSQPEELAYVLVPAGSFEMGCVPQDQGCFDDEKPRHQARVERPFWLGRTEVTVAAFRRFVQATDAQTEAERRGTGWADGGTRWGEVESRSPWSPGFEQGDDHPVVLVSWQDAAAYCGWAGGRLPTEAEFEYAARGGVAGTVYAWGDEALPRCGGSPCANVADEAAAAELGWRVEPPTVLVGYDDGHARTAPVASYPANGFGLHDLAGNVAEWCADWYGVTSYAAAAGADSARADSSWARVLRGGAWDSGDRNLRLSARRFSPPAHRDATLGFRCARDVAE